MSSRKRKTPGKSTTDAPSGSQPRGRPTLGILRLDYNYEAALGDVDCARSFAYNVLYRVVPGLTFEMCQSGQITDNVKKACARAVKFLEDNHVVAITGDCGFMINIQNFVRELTAKPVFMSSLIFLPSLCACFNHGETIAVLTANSATLAPLLPKLLKLSGLRSEDHDRIQIVGCQEVEGFDAVAKGEKVDVAKVTPGIVALARKQVANNPGIKAIVLECTELPPYCDDIKYATGLPVYDVIAVCNTFVSGWLDDPRYGLNDWAEQWDGRSEDYHFGDHLSREEKAQLVSSLHEGAISNCAAGSSG